MSLMVSSLDKIPQFNFEQEGTTCIRDSVAFIGNKESRVSCKRKCEDEGQVESDPVLKKLRRTEVHFSDVSLRGMEFHQMSHIFYFTDRLEKDDLTFQEINNLIDEMWLANKNTESISHALAVLLIEKGYGFNVVSSLKKFDYRLEEKQKLANKLIETNQGAAVISNLEKFGYTTNQKHELVDKLIETNQDYFVVLNLEKFECSLEQKHELANKLVKNGQSGIVASNLEKFDFTIKQKQELIILLIRGGRGWFFVENLEKFLDGFNTEQKQKLAVFLFETGNAFSFVGHIDKFNFTPKQKHDLMMLLIERGGVYYITVFFDKVLEGATSEQKQELADKLIEEGCEWLLVKNSEIFDLRPEQKMRAEELFKEKGGSDLMKLL